ncbi:sensor histidine kinase [Spirillospora sp. CA-294931]|uniref:sensor histidine kinase n=1 Tax=Spirillospora sp. CA-294931 TaxID=3240042 RepID=UPI003D924585
MLWETVAMLVAVAAATGCAVLWPRPADRLPAVAGGVAAVSLVSTVLHGAPGGAAAGIMGTVETAAQVVLVVLVVRYASRGHAAAAATAMALAGAAGLLRLFEPPSATAAVLMCAVWALPAACGAALGGYLRSLDAARVRQVASARRAQRMELACDLHDFVAHDLSGMVVQAQAARVVLDADPGRAAAALARIEEIGQHALATTDRTVQMLRAGPPARPHGLADLPDLTARYNGPVDLRLDPALPGTASPRAEATAYRVVTEALTNVRRHAPAASTVRVTVDRTATGALRVTVTNDLAGTGSDRPGGLGLLGLAERVEALGGTFTAGPAHGQWHVEALLPGEPA